ncbi:MAG: lipopolysaccharide biosynthesis protein [Gemmatimonas sp.]
MAPHPGRNLMWALVESGGLSVLSLAVLFVVARLLGPTDLGTAALALGVVQMLAVIPETLMHDAIVQRADLHDEDLDTAFWTCVGIGIVSAIGCWAGAPLIARAFGSDGLAPLLAVAAISLSFSATGSVAIAVLRRHFLFKALALRSLYGRLFGAGIAIALALLGFGVWSLIAQHLVQTVINVLFVWRASPWRPRLRFSWGRLSGLLSFGIFSMGTQIAWLSSAKLFTILVGYFLGVTAVGYLNVAQRVVDTLHDMLAGAAYHLALPIFSRQQDNRRALARAYRLGTEFAGISVAPIFAGVAICAHPIILLLMGEPWVPAVPVIQALAVAAMVEFPFLFADAAITAVGRPSYVFGVALLGVGFPISAFLLLRPDTLFLAAVLWGSRIVVTAPVIMVLLQRLIGRSPVEFAHETWTPLVSTATMAVFLWWLRGALPTVTPLTLLAIEIPLGALVYGTTIALVNREALQRFAAFALDGIRGRAVSPARARRDTKSA